MGYLRRDEKAAEVIDWKRVERRPSQGKIHCGQRLPFHRGGNPRDLAIGGYMQRVFGRSCFAVQKNSEGIQPATCLTHAGQHSGGSCGPEVRHCNE